jgi:hypothetical protein
MRIFYNFALSRGFAIINACLTNANFAVKSPLPDSLTAIPIRLPNGSSSPTFRNRKYPWTEKHSPSTSAPSA